jgi:uncharacterized protein with HEPN domain
VARRVDVVLREILEAIDGTLATIEGKHLKRFEAEWATQRAVERGLEIISKAARHLPDALLAEWPGARSRQPAPARISPHRGEDHLDNRPRRAAAAA